MSLKALQKAPLLAFSAVAVPGLGRHLFSPLVASRMGVVTIFDLVQPRLEMDDVTGPTKRLDNDTSICSVFLELGNSMNTAMRAESADLWHRRLGHINSRSLDVLRKVECNGIDYTGNVKACDLCAIGKSAQQTHPKKATYDIKQPFQLVLADLMGPMFFPALGGFQYVGKFVDQQTKWKEIFLIKAKSDAIDTLNCSISLWSFLLDSDWNAFEQTGVRNTPLGHSEKTAFRSESS